MYILAFFQLSLVVAIIYGWIHNIVLLAQAPEPLFQTTLLVLRLVGIFVAPLGVVLGYI